MPEKSNFAWTQAPLDQLPIPTQIALLFVADPIPRFLGADSLPHYGNVIRPYIRKFQVHTLTAFHQGKPYRFTLQTVKKNNGPQRTVLTDFLINDRIHRAHSPGINDIPRFIAWCIKEAIAHEHTSVTHLS